MLKKIEISLPDIFEGYFSSWMEGLAKHVELDDIEDYCSLETDIYICYNAYSEMVEIHYCSPK